MLVLFENSVVNLNNVTFFEFDFEQHSENLLYVIRFHGNFIDDDSCTLIAQFNWTEESKRDKAFKDILMGYQSEMKVLAILDEEEEKKDE